MLTPLVKGIKSRLDLKEAILLLLHLFWFLFPNLPSLLFLLPSLCISNQCRGKTHFSLSRPPSPFLFLRDRVMIHINQYMKQYCYKTLYSNICKDDHWFHLYYLVSKISFNDICTICL